MQSGKASWAGTVHSVTSLHNQCKSYLVKSMDNLQQSNDRLTFEKIFDLSKFVMPAVVVAGMLAGCGPDPDTPMEKVVPVEGARFKVERVGVFQDELAYNGRRGIYIIRDTDTGEEYIGISGVGVSELGSHHAGRTQISDER